MPLSKETIKATIRPAMEANLANNDPLTSREAFIDAMAGAIADAIKIGVESATIIPVLSSPSGPVTGEIGITVTVVP